ncbi:MAG: serine/threonine-protein kinase [Polyangiales bacterium]
MSDDRDSKSNPTFAPGTVLVGKFSITRAIGRGGMGTVYEGQQIALRRRVAIKTLNPELARSKDLHARFVREGELAARIRHPNVIEVIDVGEHEATPFLVLEFLEGEDLSQRLGRLGRLSVNECADLLLPVCAAIATAHEMGVVHRDLKPENIFLLTPARGPVIPKVVDFGISKLVDGATRTPSNIKLTAEGAILGTPLYLAPEVAGGAQQLDAKSDQYTFGVILYECVTGRRPFNASNLADLVGQILLGRCERPGALVEGLDPDFEAVIVRAMSKEKSARFSSMWALGRALLPFASERVRSSLSEQFLGGDSVQSQRPPPNVAPQRTPVSTPRRTPDTLAETALDTPVRTRPATRPTTTVVTAAAIAFCVVLGAVAMRSRLASTATIDGAAGPHAIDSGTVSATRAAIVDASAQQPATLAEDSGSAAAEERDAGTVTAVVDDAARASANSANSANSATGATGARRTSARDGGRRTSTGHGEEPGTGTSNFIE